MLFNWFTPTAPKTTIETIGPGARMQIDAANAYYQAALARANRLEEERNEWRTRARAAEGILEARAAQARENFRKGRENRSKATAKGEA